MTNAGPQTVTVPVAPELSAASADETVRRLLWHGMLLFLLGLLTGFAVPAFTNPRMGLAPACEKP